MLLSGLADAFRQEDRKGGIEAATALSKADISGYRSMTSDKDPSRLLAKISELDNCQPMMKLVAKCQSLLAWTCWEGSGLESEISSKLFTTELVGPDGHIPAENVRIGLLASESWTDYPVSNHSGEETYFVIAGVAEWTVGKSDYAPRQPGEFVHHPAWELHGRRTLDEPFLGAWRWSGDLDLSSFSVARS